MTEPSYMIGVDIGTTSTKAVLYRLDGTIVTKSDESYPLHTPLPDRAEQDPELIFSAVVSVVHDVITNHHINNEAIKFVSFSAAMHSVIPVDQKGNALGPCMTWADNRSAGILEEWKDKFDWHQLYRRTGTPTHPMSPLTKLLWFAKYNKSVFDKTYKFISVKEYVFYHLFGEFVVDYSIASATGMMNLKQLDWDSEALNLVGVTADQLSEIVPTTHVLSNLDPSYAEKMALKTTTPFVIGASDGVLSNLGVNAIEPGEVALTIGTSGAIRTVINEPRTDPKERIFCYALTDQHWVIGGPTNNGGIIFNWIRQEFAASETETAKRLGLDSYDVLTKIAEQVKPGSDGLIFHPYLTGERAPLWDAHARGSYIGLSINHRKEHMIRAALEGVVYNLYTVLLALSEQMDEIKSIQATGGFARSKLWRQMVSDVFNKEVHVPESYESSCLGAVVLGLYALGEIDSLSKVSDLVGINHHHVPIEENVRIYQEILPIYIRCYRLLADEYMSIASIQRGS